MFRVLGIETSCDDTGVAVVNSNGEILSNCRDSQTAIHIRNGGIMPVVARDCHRSSIDKVARMAVEQSGVCVKSDIDAIAVTNRPGLTLSLQVGLRYAKDLARKYSKPFIPIHHMQAHALTPLMKHKSAIRYPFLGLLISGGHCLLTLAKRHDNFQILGQSKDDSPGNTLEKIARKLRLYKLGHPYDSVSGGEAIELLSRLPGADEHKYFGRGLNHVPMSYSGTCDFSFTPYRSGVDSDVMPYLDNLIGQGIDREALLNELKHVCASLQRVMANQIIKKLHRALLYVRRESSLADTDPCGQCIDLVVSGGVACNKYFCDRIEQFCTEYWDPEMKMYVPDKSLCSDNGAMIAWNGVLKFEDYHAATTRGEVDKFKDIVIDSDRFDEIGVENEAAIGEDIREHLASQRIMVPRLRMSKEGRYA